MQRPEDLADRIRQALDSGDVDAIGDLLHPDAKWGSPDDPNPSCQNRDQVLRWSHLGREQGVRARVMELVVSDDKILVGTRVSGRAGEGEADRWQVLTVVDGQIADIRGFEERDEAVRRLAIRD